MPTSPLASHLAPSSDLPAWAAIAALVLVVASLALLFVEMRRRERGGVGIVVSGTVALLLLAVAVLRPVRIAARESVVGAKVVVLADASRSMALPADASGGGETRRAVRDRLLEQLARSMPDVRAQTFGFGEGPGRPLMPGDEGARDRTSDLTSALRAAVSSPDERPAAIVVVSDGRLDDPPEGTPDMALATLAHELNVPVHTVATTEKDPADASIRHVGTAGAAVAHVPLPLRVEVGCGGGLACDELTVTARELRDDGPPSLLGTGLVKLKDGHGTLDMTVTLERAGARILEVAITPPAGDTVADNDRRLLTFNVGRDHVRVLHVAGRPTNDVRALRQWLKSDASVDTVAFFILRTLSDNPQATQEDLALIPFPVDELFSVHLPSFDAVVLQDFDAQPYHLAQHLPALANYVRSGGGLIMVGGPNSFVSGGYAGTPLAEVLPVQLDASSGATAADLASFVPRWTAAGRGAPLLAPLRGVVGEELPDMPGANVLGDVRPGAIGLWTHPTRTTASGAPMPVLAVGEAGEGRSIALGVDGGWMLEFSPLGARTAGRGHGALWDGLLGWLMRDPRFEPAQLEPLGGCIAGLAGTMRVDLAPGLAEMKPAGGAAHGSIVLDVARIDRTGDAPVHREVPLPEAPAGEAVKIDVPLPPLPAGGYAARLKVPGGTTTRRDFACEGGGDEWADSRPDPERLRALARATGGEFRTASDGARPLPLPKPTVVSAERHVVPLAPAWVWSLLAALALGAHWFVRRRSGLA
jgi:uncharacterized membrane protein